MKPGDFIVIRAPFNVNVWKAESWPGDSMYNRETLNSVQIGYLKSNASPTSALIVAVGCQPNGWSECYMVLSELGLSFVVCDETDRACEVFAGTDKEASER